MSDIGKALKRQDWRFFGDALLDFKTDFLTNLKNRFTFKADDLKVNLKTGKNIMDVGKVLAKDGFDIGKLAEKIVIPCISVAGITTITFPEGGGQGQFDFSSITLKDFANLELAKGKLDKAIDTDPMLMDSYKNYGDLYMAAQQYKDAKNY